MSTDLWAEVDQAREECRRVDAIVNPARTLAVRFETLARACEQSGVTDDLVTAAETALERFGPDDEADRVTLSHLIDDVVRNVPQGVEDAPDGVVNELKSYLAGGAWSDVRDEIRAIPPLSESDGRALRCEESAGVAAVFDAITQAAVTYCDDRRDAIREMLSEGFADMGDGASWDPLVDLEEQPIALLPIRLETRFVDEDEHTLPSSDEFWIRVYPDRIHRDTHERELTEKEIRWGKRFWGTLWLAAHPDPKWAEDPQGEYLVGSSDKPARIADPTLREFISGIDLEPFSSNPLTRYEQLKSRAWGSLVERVSEQRAGYVVHVLAPTDEHGRDISLGLLTPPAGTTGPFPELDPDSEVGFVGTDPDEDDSEGTDEGSDENGGPNLAYSGDPDTGANVEFSTESSGLPPLRFPDVPLRPETWTKQATAPLAPDRWVAVLEWTDGDGDTQRSTIAGEAIPDPLPLGPRIERWGEDEDDTDLGIEWMRDIETAFEIGMALRVELSDLPGWDGDRGFDRVLVVGVKASMSAAETPEGLVDLLAAHQYTDGFSIPPVGTETNAGDDDPTGALDLDDAAIQPPRVGALGPDEDRQSSDGDLLARTLALPMEDGHPFAHVPGAERTEQRDAREANSALWPATIGYTLSNLFVPNRLIGRESIWPNGPAPIDYPEQYKELVKPLALLEAYRRHFIRYVRARGPLPTIRVGDQPYGVLPVMATSEAVTTTQPEVVEAIEDGELTIRGAEDDGVPIRDVVGSDLSPESLLEAGAGPAELYDNGVDAVELLEAGVDLETTREFGGPVADLREGDVSAARLSDASVPPKFLAWGEAPESELEGTEVEGEEVVQAGFDANKLIEAGFGVEELLGEGVAPSALVDVLRERGSLEDLEVPAGSLRLAGIPVEDLLNSGYSIAELLAGGYSEREVSDAGGTLEDVETPARSIRTLVEEGWTAERLRDHGFGPAQLFQAGFTPEALFEGGYTSGELLDAGVSLATLVEYDCDLGPLLSAGVRVIELLEAGATPSDLCDTGVSPRELAEAGVPVETVVDAGYTPGELAATGIEFERMAETENEVGGEPAGIEKPGDAVVEIPESYRAADRDLHAFSYDPARPRELAGQPGDPTSASSHPSASERAEHQTDGGSEADDDGGVPTPIYTFARMDEVAAEHVERFVTALRSDWSVAVADLPFAEKHGEWSVLDVLERNAVSRALHWRTGWQGYLKEDQIFQVEEFAGIVDWQPSEFRSQLVAQGLTELDPRLAYMYAVEELAPGIDEGVTHPQNILERYHIAGHKIGTFLDILSEESPDDLRAIKHQTPPPSEMPFDPDDFEALDDGQELLEDIYLGRVGSIPFSHTSVIEALKRVSQNDQLEIDATTLVEQYYTDDGVGKDLGLYREKLDLMAGLADEYGDTGILSSVARALFYHALQREYLDARLRVGVLYRDPPSSSWGFSDLDEIPTLELEQLGVDGHLTWWDVFHQTSRGEPATTSIDPRLPEFTNSLAHLSELDATTVARLTCETLDLQSHRLDAWWTSLATKRLFELRERQTFGTVDPMIPPVEDEDNRTAGIDTAPGLYVGGYGVVENVTRGEDDTPEYVHAPSPQQAATAAYLRSGYLAAEERGSDETNHLAIDLSADRVKDAEWLLDGVRRGQSLAELLGYRFERRLHEVTLGDGPNLLKYRRALRMVFPGVIGALDFINKEMPPEERAQLAQSDVLDGYRLVQEWVDPGEGESAFEDLFAEIDPDAFEDGVIPDYDSVAHEALTTIVDEFRDDLDAVRDLLLADSIHQLGQRNVERAGSTLDALSTGTRVPEPTITSFDRGAKGVTHRILVLLSPETALEESGLDGVLDPTFESTAISPEVPHFMARAEPTLERWLDSLLPDFEDVGCIATYEWSVTIDEEEQVHDHERTLVLTELNLSALDLLSVAGDIEHHDAGELSRRLEYYLRRQLPAGVPPDAELDFELGDPGHASVSLERSIETARSLRTLVYGSRAATGVDLCHPKDTSHSGYLPDESFEPIRERADAIQAELESIEETLRKRLDVHGVDDEGSVDPNASLTKRVDRATAAIEAVMEDDTLEGISAALSSIEPDQLSVALEELALSLPVGPKEPGEIPDRLVVRADQKQSVDGQLQQFPAPPSTEGDVDEDETTSADLILADSSPAADETDPYLDDEDITSLIEAYSGDADGADEDGGDESNGGDAETDGGVANAESADVLVWGISATDTFQKGPKTVAVEYNRFEATFDFSDVEPGARFTAVALIDGDVYSVRPGHVIAQKDASQDDPAEIVRQRPTLRALCWLAAIGEEIAIHAKADTPLAELRRRLDDVEWGGEDDEGEVGKEIASADRPGMIQDSPVLSDADIEAVASLIALDEVDLAALVEPLGQLLESLGRLGFTSRFDVIGAEDGHAEARFRYVPFDPGVTVAGGEGKSLGYDLFDSVSTMRRRLRGVLTDASGLDPISPPQSIGFDPTARAIVRGTSSPWATAVVLDALARAPAWVVRPLSGIVDDPHQTLVRLGVWTFQPERLRESELQLLSEELELIAENAPRLEPLFTIAVSTTSDDIDPVSVASGALSELANAIPDAVEPGSPTPLSNLAEERVTEVAEILEPILATLEDVDGADSAACLRRIALERLREPLFAASYARSYAAVPRVPAASSPSDEEALLEQAFATFGTVSSRLARARNLDPAHETYGFGNEAVDIQVEAQCDRIRTLLDEDVSVLPGFVPPNTTELEATFSDDLLDGAGPLEAETWLQRLAQVRERPDRFREALTFAQSVTGERQRDLTVGQLPHREGRTWVGANGVEPERGTLSLVAQFGGQLDPHAGLDWLTGLYVDSWIELVPEDTATTAVAFQFDHPKTQPPQSVLLAVPRPGEKWSLGSLVGAVGETIDFARYRAIDQMDLDLWSVELPSSVESPYPDDVASVHLPEPLPSIYLPSSTGQNPPDQPEVYFDRDGAFIDYVPQLLAQYAYRRPPEDLGRQSTAERIWGYSTEEDEPFSGYAYPPQPSDLGTQWAGEGLWDLSSEEDSQ